MPASVSTPLPPRTDAIRWDLLSVESTAILRQVLVPIHSDGYTVKETAERLQITPGSVRLLTAYFVSEVGSHAPDMPE